jgi:methyl-accepting chemotaxis protein
VKLTNLKITPKLGILLGITLVGLSMAGVLAGYLMQREMLNARIDQTKAIVEMAKNMAAGFKKQIDAGQMTKEQARAEFGKRGSALTYDNGNGYLFGTTYDGITVMAPNPAHIGQNRMGDVINGRKLSQELMDGVKKNGEILLYYEYMKPGTEKPIRKIGYAVDAPGLDMYVGTGAYLADIDAKMAPIAWLLGLAVLGIAIVSGSIAWMIGRSISKPLGELGARMQALAEGELDGDIPGIGRGDEIGVMGRRCRSSRIMRCASAGWSRPRPRTRSGAPPSAARRWKTSPMISSAPSAALSTRSRPRRPACRAPRN